ncbi:MULTISPECIES: helix-turn-helix domain-containing protein [Bacillus subtilis group]|uniref:helix-turn-helix domain-containing protein n=1 Tax=Bacillus paralicheniformis TaxID=1648923 RepID=UPI001FD6B78A|nr:helix-turn-helix transcriptional regulator [Bacillus paralicheniformis]MCJ8221389.1 helix-turn-helix domain-containing protein [Bacillus paralicheniformis]WMW46650.1 helix-turn-helix transcriptional regulator [Bacillus paralicheniformis]
MAFSKRLTMLRKSKNLLQKEVADKIGVARTTYASYEQGKREPDIETINKIADFFDVSTDYLLRGIINQKVDKIMNDPETLIAARDGDITKEEARELLEWLLKKSFDDENN